MNSGTRIMEIRRASAMPRNVTTSANPNELYKLVATC